MSWTIEKIRELSEGNWLGIKRVGEHAWEIGGDVPGGMVMYTGDGGVVEYVNTLMKTFNNYVSWQDGLD